MSTGHPLPVELTCTNPICNNSFYAAVDPRNRANTPRAGAFSVCIRCGALSVFTSTREDGSADGIRPPTADERAKAANNEQFRSMVEFVVDRNERDKYGDV